MSDEELGDKSGAPQCGIYIRIELPMGKMGEKDGDYSGVMQKTQLIMKTVNEESEHEKNMHVIEVSGGHPESLKIICDVIRSKGFVVVMNGDHEKAASCGADGVMLARGVDVSAVRIAVGEDFIIGVKSDLHEDADYVSLAPVAQDIMAFCAKTNKLCLASGTISKDAAPSLMAAGATFLDMSDYIFNHDQGVVKATAKVLSAMQKAEEYKSQAN
ncbi:MAG: hypothetical protein AAF204_00205 [Pseudomonadota bacterium]